MCVCVCVYAKFYFLKMLSFLKFQFFMLEISQTYEKKKKSELLFMK